jgi:uncharacterized protein YjiS (DUF1127 family)
MTYTNVIGYVAATLVFATFCAKDMIPLRMLAIASNVGFISYGLLDNLWPILILHLAMLPINSFRLFQLLPVLRSSAPLAFARDPSAGPESARKPLGAPEPAAGERLRSETLSTFPTPGYRYLAFVRRWRDLWGERIRLRRDLAMMSARDFGDLAIPPGLLRDELRRWPWQACSPEWRETAVPTRRQATPEVTNRCQEGRSLAVDSQ